MRNARATLTTTSTDMSTTSLTSDWFYMANLVWVAFQFAFSGAPVGTWSLEWSNDDIDPSFGQQNAAAYRNTNITTITPLTGASLAVAATDTNGGLFVADFPALWVRAKYTKTSGTGTVSTVNAVGKGTT